jgi:hypothetical protein
MSRRARGKGEPLALEAVRLFSKCGGKMSLGKWPTSTDSSVNVVAIESGQEDEPLLAEAMELLGTELSENTYMYGERHGQCRWPMMLQHYAAEEGFVSIIAADQASGRVVGVIVLRTVREVMVSETYAELVMLRCIPAGQGVGCALMEALKNCLKAQVRQTDDVILLAYALKDRATRRFFVEHNDFILEQGRDSTAERLLPKLYAWARDKFLVRQSTTHTAWNARWDEATRREKKAKNAVKRAKAAVEKAEAAAAAAAAAAGAVDEDTAMAHAGMAQAEEAASATSDRADVAVVRDAVVRDATAQAAAAAAAEAAAAEAELTRVEASMDELARLDFAWNQNHKGCLSLLMPLRQEAEVNAAEVQAAEEPEAEVDEASALCRHAIQDLHPKLMFALANGWLAHEPPFEAVIATLEDVKVGDELWVEYSQDGVWFKANVVQVGTSWRLHFLDGDKWTWKKTEANLSKSPPDYQWRRIITAPGSHAAADLAGTVDAAGTAGAAGAAGPSSAASAAGPSSVVIDLSADTEDEMDPPPPPRASAPPGTRLLPITWERDWKDTGETDPQGNAIFRGPIKRSVAHHFETTSKSKMMEMVRMADGLLDSELMSQFGPGQQLGRLGKRKCREEPRGILQLPTVASRPTSKEREAAKFTFADLCHGIGGALRACRRLDGLLVAACDMDSATRPIYRDILLESKVNGTPQVEACCACLAPRRPPFARPAAWLCPRLWAAQPSSVLVRMNVASPGAARRTLPRVPYG